MLTAVWLMLSSLLYSLQLSTGSFPRPLTEEEERYYLKLSAQGDLEAYMDKHPFDPGDSDCETVLDQLYQAYAESHESRRSATASKNWTTSWVAYPWRITMPYGTSVANSVPPTNIKLFLMASNTART